MTLSKPPFQFGFIVEQALGHITHGKNLQRVIPQDVSVQARWILPGNVPPKQNIFSSLYQKNWTVNASMQTRQALSELQRQRPFDGLFFHSQITAVLAQSWLERIPSIVSLDATPLQYDRLGHVYSHDSGPNWLERWKWRMNRDCFRKARHLVTWSEWAKQGLVDEYEVPADKIMVIPPGVNVSLWQRTQPKQANDGVTRILFVGGNMERKGGLLLLDAFRKLRQEGCAVELHLVTRDPVLPREGLYAYDNLQPNSPQLIALYHNSDIFCLPTYGDCLPMVLSEAAAAELPLISTRVAAIPEVVKDGETGLLIPTGDVEALLTALRTLITNPRLRHQMGAAGCRLVRTTLDAEQNAFRLLDLMKMTVTEYQTRNKQ
jgi:glycosyltransferase involved in cell wall biosynthesis